MNESDTPDKIFASRAKAVFKNADQSVLEAFYDTYVDVKRSLQTGRSGMLNYLSIKKLSRLSSDIMLSSDDPDLKGRESRKEAIADGVNKIWEMAEQVYTELGRCRDK